jgi:hypothetical protein
MTRIPLERIRLDGGTQARAELDSEAVKDYAAAYQAGDELPPVVLFSDGPYLWMADGFHRYGGAKLAGLKEIEAEVREGTQRDALLYAVGCNDTHGLRRTPADKRHAVALLLADPEWAERSDNWIAEQCRVSQPFVANVRASTHQHQSKRATSNVRSSRARKVGKDGKKRKPRARGGRQPGDEPERAPALCDRCERVGSAACEKCKAAGAKPKAKKGGAVIFDWRAFDRDFLSLMRQVAALGRGYEQAEATDHVADALVEWRSKFRDVYQNVTGQKPPADPHERGAA